MFRKSVTDSGLRILSEEMPEAQSASIGVWVSAGCSTDPEGKPGLSHFLEHMLFKGTSTRTAADIAGMIDSLGGCFEGFTDREFICVYTRVLPEHIPLALELLGDMFSHPRFEAKEVEIEQRVILEEIELFENSPEEFLNDCFVGTIWEGSPLARNGLGTRTSVSQVSVPVLKEYWEQMFHPQNIVISAAGRLKHEQLVRLTERYFSDLPAGSRRIHHHLFTTPPEVKRRHRIIHKYWDRVHLCVGTRGFSQRSPQRFAVFLLETMIAGGCSSRLFQEIREKRGLAYSIGANSYCCGIAGFLAVSVSFNLESARRVVNLIARELRSIKRNGVTKRELKRAKEQLRVNLLLAGESPGDRMTRNAQDEFYHGRRIPVAEEVEAIEAVEPDDIHAVAAEILDDELLNVVGIGPFGEDDVQLEISVG